VVCLSPLPPPTSSGESPDLRLGRGSAAGVVVLAEGAALGEIGGLWRSVVVGRCLVGGAARLAALTSSPASRAVLLRGERLDNGATLFKIVASSVWPCTVVCRGSRLHISFNLRESDAIGR
jgi:hypothetical protein